MTSRSEKITPEQNMDNILFKIKEEIRQRGFAAPSNIYRAESEETVARRETSAWIKARKVNMRIKNGRFYLLILPFVSILRYLFQKFRYRNNFCASDLILLSDEELLKTCYFNILGRRPDKEGMNHHLVSLRTGKNDKIGVINAFIRSKEAKRRKARVDGLCLFNVRRFFVRIPLLGYLIRLMFSVLLLPRRLKEISTSIDRISANIDGIKKEQLYLRNKINDLEEHPSDTR